MFPFRKNHICKATLVGNTWIKLSLFSADDRTSDPEKTVNRSCILNSSWYKAEVRLVLLSVMQRI